MHKEKLHLLIAAMAERIYAQAELLARRVERKPMRVIKIHCDVCKIVYDETEDLAFAELHSFPGDETNVIYHFCTECYEKMEKYIRVLQAEKRAYTV